MIDTLLARRIFFPVLAEIQMTQENMFQQSQMEFKFV